MYSVIVPLVFRYCTCIQANISPPMTIHIHLFLCVGACFQGHLRRNQFQLGSYLERFPLKMSGKAAEILIISHHLLIEVNSQLTNHISLECPQWDLINSFSRTILTFFSKMLSWPDDLYHQMFIILLVIDWKGNPNGLWNLKLKFDIETTAYIEQPVPSYLMFSSYKHHYIKDGQCGVYLYVI